MMMGADETKSYILKTISDKVITIEQNGCALGKMQDLRISNLEHCTNNMDSSIKEIIRVLDQKMNWIITGGIILSFLAGVNVLGEVLKLLGK
jgi:uncharacterized membrane protein YoaK (UPF0700 family)